jgi:hypothetical protein
MGLAKPIDYETSQYVGDQAGWAINYSKVNEL